MQGFLYGEGRCDVWVVVVVAHDAGGVQDEVEDGVVDVVEDEQVVEMDACVDVETFETFETREAVEDVDERRALNMVCSSNKIKLQVVTFFFLFALCARARALYPRALLLGPGTLLVLLLVPA